MTPSSVLCRHCARLASGSLQRANAARTFGSTPSLGEAQKAPLLPSVQHLLHENNISTEDAAKIPASGPNGRLLKGDVLAHLGQIDKKYPQEQAKRLNTLSHLDLSNIKLAAPKKAEAPAPPPAPPAAAQVEEPGETEIAVPISLAAALACQKRVHEALGISMPLSTFVARAVEMANDDLPRSQNGKPTANELFDSVLGLDNVVSHKSRGKFMPSIVTLPPPASSLRARTAAPRKLDIVDVLAGNTKPVPAAKATGSVQGAGAQNVFSVSAAKGEEKRATLFLERMKAILEVEPGRLIL